MTRTIGGLAAVAILVFTSVHVFGPKEEPQPFRILSPSPHQMLMTGDSIGVGIAGALKMKSVAVVGQTHDRIAEQMKRVDPCWSGVVLASVGTNEASQGRTYIDVDMIVRATTSAMLCNPAGFGVKRELVIIGPPCVKRPWDRLSADIDSRLATDAATRGLRFISMRKFCNTAGDGVHPASYAPLAKHLADELAKE